MRPEEDWVDDPPPPLRAKVLALKVCRNRCLAHAQSDTAREIAAPVIRMFSTVLQYEGRFRADAQETASTKSRLRLQAATSMLHLSAVATYVPEVTKYFVQIALTIQVRSLWRVEGANRIISQDPAYQVRGRAHRGAVDVYGLSARSSRQRCVRGLSVRSGY